MFPLCSWLQWTHWWYEVNDVHSWQINEHIYLKVWSDAVKKCSVTSESTDSSDFTFISNLNRENVKSRNPPHNRQKRRKLLIFLIKCLLLPLYYSPYTRMCNKSQISSPFKNGKASLRPSIRVSPRTFPTTCYRQVQNNHKKTKKNLLRFLFLRFTTVTQPAKVQQTTSTRRTCVTAHLTLSQSVARPPFCSFVF